LACLEPRSLHDLAIELGQGMSETEIAQIMDRFVEDKIVYKEPGPRPRYLSLAVATSPHIAARRIRERRRPTSQSSDRTRLEIIAAD
jgi:hypothetical protein